MIGQYLSLTGFKSIIVGLIMYSSSFKDKTFVAKELLKLNNTRKALFNKVEHYFLLFFVIKHLWMFNMSDLSIEL